MILWLGLLLCLTLWGASFRRDGIAAYYISRDGTNAVRGVFILLILGMHFTQYVSASADPAVTAFWAVRRFFDQLAVCMFLFYSGYGVALSFAEKGEGYRKSFLQKRMLPTLMAYDVSVLLFILIECTVGEGCSFGYCLRALLAWESMGNDNWYIFVILGLYGISWLSACVQVRCFGKISAAWMIGGVTLGTAAFALFLSAAGRREFWYNTIVCFPFGVLFCYVRSRAERALEKPLPYWVSLFAVLGLFLIIPWFYFTFYVAGLSGYSLSRFKTRFREETGQTPALYITALRVERAKLELERTDQSVTDIAFNLGWSSGNYFCTVFKKLTGVSPLTYRRQNRMEDADS